MEKNIYYICHTIIVVTYMVLVGVVVFVSSNYLYLWLLLAILVYQPWYKLKDVKGNGAADSQEKS